MTKSFGVFCPSSMTAIDIALSEVLTLSPAASLLCVDITTENPGLLIFSPFTISVHNSVTLGDVFKSAPRA